MHRMRKNIDIHPNKNCHQLGAKTNLTATVMTFTYVFLICKLLEWVKPFFTTLAVMMND